MTNQKTIVFHHIPKTAGTTFYAILEKEYAPSESFRVNGMNPLQSLQQFRALTQDQINKYRLVYGHLADKFLPLLNSKSVCIIFLREPVDHFISSYYFIKRSEFNRFHKNVENLSIEEFIDMRLEEHLDNLQTRHVAGKTDFLLSAGQQNAHCGDEIEKIYEMAKQRLQKAEFVLITEKFDESIVLLHDDLHWSKWPYYRKRNKTKHRPLVNSFDKNIIKRIAEVNKWDIKLYELAVNKFNSSIAARDTGFKERVRRFEFTNRLLNKTGFIHFVER